MGGKNKKQTLVLKTLLHCNDCSSKIIKCIRDFDGVESVEIKDGQRVVVLGDVDPEKLRREVEEKTYRKVEIVFLNKEEDRNSGADVQTPVANSCPDCCIPIQVRNPYGAPWIQNPYSYGAPWVLNPNPYVAPWVPNPNPYGALAHEPQTFSDENPNACNVM